MSNPNNSGLSSWRVLLVDDHDDVLFMLRTMMTRTRQEFSVETANSGFAAVKLAEDFAPHLVISDIGMPEMDGYEMMAMLRDMEREAGKLIPFKSIALTGYDAEDEKEAVQSAGFDAQLTKPVDFDALFDTIDRLLDSDGFKPDGNISGTI